MMANPTHHANHFPASAPFSFTYENLLTCLYRRNESQDKSTLAGNASDKPVRKVGSLPSPSNTTEKRNEIRFTSAVKSCPDELELCPSVTCSLKYGVRTRQAIPEGTWMGPYQGPLVTPSDVTTETDTSYMWEIYENGKLLHYIDGCDEGNSSWMRFIRCARHKGEQNLYVFQYNREIYYRAFATIPAGEELLVWYEDNYPQYMGIPLNIIDIGRQLDHNANCPVHTETLTQVNSANQGSDWQNHEVSRLPHKPIPPKSFNSTVFAPPSRHAHYRTPNFFTSDEYQIAHVRREKKCSQRDQYGQLFPVSTRRAIVIQKADDAPDPFCILTREK